MIKRSFQHQFSLFSILSKNRQIDTRIFRILALADTLPVFVNFIFATCHVIMYNLILYKKCRHVISLRRICCLIIFILIIIIWIRPFETGRSDMYRRTFWCEIKIAIVTLLKLNFSKERKFILVFEFWIFEIGLKMAVLVILGYQLFLKKKYLKKNIYNLENFFSSKLVIFSQD